MDLGDGIVPFWLIRKKFSGTPNVIYMWSIGGFWHKVVDTWENILAEGNTLTPLMVPTFESAFGRHCLMTVESAGYCIDGFHRDVEKLRVVYKKLMDV